MQGLLGSLDLNYLWGEILRLARDPYSNINAALLLLAVVVIVVLIIASIVIAVVTGRASRPWKSQELEELQYLLSLLEAEKSGQEVPVQVQAPVPPTLRERLAGYPWFAIVVAACFALVIVGVALGATTASSAVCGACHLATPHSTAVREGVADPHAKVGCVRCHESSGWLGSVTIEVPERLLHYANGLKKNPGPTHYGVVVSSPCSRCHSSVALTTTLDEQRGVKMAHKQPLQAGAECRDCHTADTGVVSSLTVGMAPCLRCHDGKQQSAKCKLCHTKDVGVATRSHVNSAELAGRKLIATPDCGACHDQERKCDPCHGGVRMPHTDLFKWWGHARAGVKDIWDNNGKACATCHGGIRRPCTKCHAFFPGHPAPLWRSLHGATGNRGACAGCHDNKAYVAGRDLCALCHTKPYVTQ